MRPQPNWRQHQHASPQQHDVTSTLTETWTHTAGANTQWHPQGESSALETLQNRLPRHAITYEYLDAGACGFTWVNMAGGLLRRWQGSDYRGLWRSPEPSG